MQALGMISKDDLDKAKNADANIAPLNLDATDAPYLVDYIREELAKEYSSEALLNGNLKVYTSLDPIFKRPPLKL